MPSKSSNNFSIIYLYCIILRNVNINLRFYIITLCKHMDCRIYMGVFILGNISINLRFYISNVNIRTAAFTSAHLYWGILRLP